MNIQLWNGSSAVALSNVKTGMNGARLMAPAEFKRSKGLKGNAGRNAYNAYLKEHGTKLNGGVGHAMLEGKILLTGVRRWEKSGKWQITAVETEKLVDKAAKAAAPTRADALAALGLTEEQLAQLASLTK
jgi:hypothetical protein